MSRLVIALGGNALGNYPDEQQANIRKAVKNFLPLIEAGHEIIITHGNGPQVGIINLAFEDSYENDDIPYMPLTECTAMSQGYIGYHLQKNLKQYLPNRKIVSLITQVVVDRNDQAFNDPSKPIGPFYSKETALRLAKTTNEVFALDANRGYRKVVASPIPQDIVEIETIKDLLKTNHIVITCGGGGIPVFNENNNEPIAAVIDKDLASSKLAIMLKADYLIILTTVNHAELNFGKPNHQILEKITTSEAKQYLNEGHFAKGSMKPKIEAAINFVNETNNKAIITGLNNLSNALNEIDCTVIVK